MLKLQRASPLNTHTLIDNFDSWLAFFIFSNQK